MNKLGIQSLNAGAPDLRLTGSPETYTQRRRRQMAYGGIAGLDGRKAYGIGSWFQKAKDKVVDDFIPNEIKENPLLTAALVGGGINQFGLPDFLTGGTDVGQNWIGDLLGGQFGLPEDLNLVIGDDRNLLGQYTGEFPDAYAGGNMPDYGPFTIGGGIGGALDGRSQALLKAAGYIPDLANDPIGYAKQVAQNAAQNTVRKIVGDDSPDVTPDASGRYPINWKGPLGIGAAIGLADYATRSDEKMPPQVSINIPQSGQEAFADERLRFKPKEQYVDTMAMAADGGRIGFTGGTGGNTYQDFLADKTVRPQPDDKSWRDVFYRWLDKQRVNQAQGGRIGYSEGGDDIEWRKIYNKYKAKQIALGQEFADFEEFVDQHRVNEAQGGRIGYAEAGDVLPEAPMSKEEMEERAMGSMYDEENPMTRSELKKFMERQRQKRLLELLKNRRGAQEGGLMNLGGMEKDYRQEGGFVPIGGREKADDVPARLSKNEFVFTADAVRAAGGGDIDAGAQVMENLMENLEAGGKVSEDSQGLEGAQAMFANTQKLQNRII